MAVRRRPVTCFLAVLVWALAAPGAVEAQTPDWGAALERFGATLAADVAADGIGGIAAGVAVDGDLVWARGFGWADRDAGVPMGPAAISRTGSISKSVTALLMMILVERGVIGLDEPVARYLPELEALADPRPGAPPPTFRHLASHTAGLIREPRLEGAAEGPFDGWRDKVLASIPETAFDSVPGARYQYSNIGFGILGLALERAADRPFTEMVEEEIFAPLGMTGSTFRVAEDGLEERLARGYENRADGAVDAARPQAEHAGRGYKVPNGGVYATVADLARFAGALSGVPGLRVLGEAPRREMLRLQTPGDLEQGYGLGLTLQRHPDGSWTAGHGGSVAGYTATFQFDPEARVAVVLLRNYQTGRTDLGGRAAELLAELRASLRR